MQNAWRQRVMIFLLGGLGLLMMALYFFAEMLTTDTVWDWCLYATKSIFSLIVSLVCIVASR